MKAEETERGFIRIMHEKHQNKPGEITRLVQESSAENPGSSFLWVGNDHHLNRDEIRDLINRMQYWLDTKRLELR